MTSELPGCQWNRTLLQSEIESATRAIPSKLGEAGLKIAESNQGHSFRFDVRIPGLRHVLTLISDVIFHGGLAVKELIGRLVFE